MQYLLLNDDVQPHLTATIKAFAQCLTHMFNRRRKRMRPARSREQTGRGHHLLRFRVRPAVRRHKIPDPRRQLHESRLTKEFQYLLLKRNSAQIKKKSRIMAYLGARSAGERRTLNLTTEKKEPINTENLRTVG